jgi:hypothetical protein
MKCLRFLKIASLFLFIFALSSASSTFANEKECLNEIQLLIKHKENAQFDGGFWSLFEKSRKLNSQSVIGLNVDKEINQLIGHLTHLCETLDGIALNDLAMIIRDDLKLMSEEEYRKQLTILGKPDKEIDIWFKFYSFSLKHEHRTLDYLSIKETLNLSKKLVFSYVKLYLVNQSKLNSDAFKTQVVSLLDQISSFTKSNKDIVQAGNELAQIPYWDIQESVGGS